MPIVLNLTFENEFSGIIYIFLEGGKMSSQQCLLVSDQFWSII